jgi:hypothetical protein
MPKQAQFWQKGDSPILYMPLPIGVELEDSPHKRTLCAGAAGSAKSYTGRWFLYSQCRKLPGSRWLLLRCSYDELDKNHLQFIPAECEQLGDAEWSGGNVRRVTFANDSKIFCGYCDDLADIPKHLGPEWDGVVFEEAVNFLERALSEISARDRGSQTAQRPVGVEKDGRTFCLTNPGGRGMMYLVDHYIRKEPDPAEYPHYNAEMHGHIPATLRDNPYLPEDYATKNLSGLSAARYKQLAHGDWTVLTGQFFDAFDPSVHVVAMEAV